MQDLDEVEEYEGKTTLAEGLLTADTFLHITSFKTISFHIWKN